MARRMGLLLAAVLLAWAAPAAADDEAEAPEVLAREALDAHASGKTKTLREVALRKKPGPFLVTDALLAQGADPKVLAAFAKQAAKGPAGKTLPALVRRWKALSDDARAREAERHACLARLSALPPEAAFERLAELDACLAVEPDDADTSVGAARLLRLRGSLCYEFGRHDEAIDSFDRLVERADALGAPTMKADALYQSGRPRYVKQDFAGALAREEESLAIYRTLGDMERVVWMLRGAAMCHFALRDLENAETLYREAVELAEAHDQPRGGGDAALLLGDVLLEQGRHLEAAALYARGIAWAKATGDVQDQVMGSVNRAAAFQRAGEFDQAAAQYEELLPLVKQSGNVMGEAIIEGNLVACMRTAQRPADALRHALRAVALYEQLGALDRAAPLANQIALVHLDLDDVERAAEAAERAIQIAQATGSKYAVGRALIARANVRSRAGDYDGAFSDAEATREIALELGHQGLLCEALVKLATAEERRGRYTEALSVGQEALEVARQMGNRSAVALASTVLGHVYWALRDFDNGRAAYERAAATYEESGSVDALINVLHSFAGMLSEEGKLAEAHEIAKRANAALGEQGSYLRTAGLVVEATTLIKLLRYEEAKQLLLEARTLGDTPQRALIEGNLGFVNMHLKRFDEALPHAKEAVALHRRMGERWELAGALQLVAELEAHAGNHAAAAEAARNAVALRRDMARGLGAKDRGLLSPLARTAEDIGLFSLTQLLADEKTATPERMEEALWMAEMGRSLSLLEGLVNRDAILEVHVDPDLDRAEREAAAAVRKAQQRLLGLLDKEGATDEEIGQAEAAFRLAEELRHDAVRQIQRESRHAAALAYPSPVKSEVLAQALRSDEALVLHHMLPDGSVIAVVATRRGMTVREIVRYGDEDIRPELARFRELVATKGADDKSVAASLHAQLIAPLADRLEGVRRLLLSPDGDLAFLPYEALVTDEKTGARLIETYEVAYVPSATVLAELRAEQRPAAGARLLAVGDPAYGERVSEVEDLPARVALRGIGSLGRLTHSGEEVRALARLYGPENTELLVRGDASVERLANALAEGERLAALHLACHGIFVPEHAQLSGLVLAGREVLTLDDLYRSRVRADLVVLSACESGQGRIERGEGVIGLVRGFLFAGAPRVVVSNWNVQDDSTKDLMLDFHRRLRSGDGAAKALREAKLAMRASGDRKHPYYWAPFVLWGLPD